MVFVATSIAFNLINNNNVALCARRTTYSRRVVFFDIVVIETKNNRIYDLHFLQVSNHRF